MCCRHKTVEKNSRWSILSALSYAAWTYFKSFHLHLALSAVLHVVQKAARAVGLTKPWTCSSYWAQKAHTDDLNQEYALPPLLKVLLLSRFSLLPLYRLRCCNLRFDSLLPSFSVQVLGFTDRLNLLSTVSLLCVWHCDKDHSFQSLPHTCILI